MNLLLAMFHSPGAQIYTFDKHETRIVIGCAHRCLAGSMSQKTALAAHGGPLSRKIGPLLCFFTL
jgi:hypothetical protein